MCHFPTKGIHIRQLEPAIRIHGSDLACSADRLLPCRSSCMEHSSRTRLESEHHRSCFQAFVNDVVPSSTPSALGSFWWCDIQILSLTVMTLKNLSSFSASMSVEISAMLMWFWHQCCICLFRFYVFLFYFNVELHKLYIYIYVIFFGKQAKIFTPGKDSAPHHRASDRGFLANQRSGFTEPPQPAM